MDADRTAARQEVQGAIERLLRLQQSRRVHGELMTAARTQLSQPSVVLLTRIRSEGSPTIGDLARVTHMDMSLVSRELRKLEADGLVSRAADASDGRVTRVALTPRGRGLVRRLTRVRDRHIEETFSGWTTDDMRTLSALMGRFVDDMQTVRYRGNDTPGSS